MNLIDRIREKLQRKPELTCSQCYYFSTVRYPHCVKFGQLTNGNKKACNQFCYECQPDE